MIMVLGILLGLGLGIWLFRKSKPLWRRYVGVWWTTCDSCGDYVLCRVFAPTLDGTPHYNLCVMCLHNAARHQIMNRTTATLLDPTSSPNNHDAALKAAERAYWADKGVSRHNLEVAIAEYQRVRNHV